MATLASALLGLAMGHALARTQPDQLPDLTLRLAALLTVVLPPLVLQLVTTPPHAATRRLLGETATQMLAVSRRGVVQWTLVVAVTPLTLALYGLAVGSAALVQVAAILGGAVPLVAGLAFAAMLHGLRLLAGGRHAGWTAVSGGGAFGPAEAAPLLYLPAFALIGGLAPVALLTAVWNARPEWLTPTVWRVIPIAGVLLGLRFAATASRRARPHLHAGLRAAEQAHASRFAQADGLAEPPLWLTLGQPAAPQQFLARAWHRRWPLAGQTTLALVLVTWILARPDAPRWTAALTGFGLAALTQTRVLALRQEPAWQASEWLGLDHAVRKKALLRLAVALTLPGLPLLALGASNAFGAGVGALFAFAALRWDAASRNWIRASWLMYGVGLAASATGGL